MVGTRRLTELVESATRRLALPEGTLVVALSGGADSATLAFLCQSLGRVTRALHVHHGLPYSDHMERAARAVAGAVGLDISVVRVTVPGGASPEGQARGARYEAFARSVLDDESLLTAHTQDDQVETVVFNLIRGTGSSGLGGIPHHRRPNVYRPILAVTRAETREIASLAGLPFEDDPMNEDSGLSRNVIRRRVIPTMSELNPRLSASVARAAAAIRADDEYLGDRASEVLLERSEAAVAVAVGDLAAVPAPIADRVLKNMTVEVGGTDSVSSERIDRIRRLVKGGTQRTELVAGIVAWRQGPMLVVGRVGESETSGSVPLHPGLNLVGDREYEVLAHESVCQVVPLSRWAAIFPIGTLLRHETDGIVSADGEPAWAPGERRLPVAWYEPGSVGYLSVSVREKTAWTSSR